MKISLLMAVVLITFGVAYGEEKAKYEEKCTITTGSGISVDSCDASKFLTCTSGYCRCNDPATQLYDYLLVEPNSRSKRSPKKGSKGGGFKKGAGVGAIVGGAGGAYIGYQAGKAVANANNNNNGNGGSYSSSSSFGRQEQRRQREYSCYGRVGSQCVLSYNNVNIVSLETTTTTTTTTTTAVAPSSSSDASVSETTTAASNVTAASNTSESAATSTAAPSASALTDISKIPKCVRNAVCQRQTSSSNATSNGGPGHFVTVEGDPRIGVCVCAPGYVATKTDQCVKAPNGASNLSVGFSVIFLALISKILI